MQDRARHVTPSEVGKAARRRKLLLRLPAAWVFVLLYFAGVGLQLRVPVNVSSPVTSRVIRIAGSLVLATGVGFTTWSLLLFRRAATRTVSGKRLKVLVTGGPYRFTRNPTYIALILDYLGEEGLFVQIWPLPFLPLAVAYLNFFVIRAEEASLMALDGYRQYCASVRRWM